MALYENFKVDGFELLFSDRRAPIMVAAIRLIKEVYPALFEVALKYNNRINETPLTTFYDSKKHVTWINLIDDRSVESIACSLAHETVHAYLIHGRGKLYVGDARRAQEFAAMSMERRLWRRSLLAKKQPLTEIGRFIAELKKVHMEALDTEWWNRQREIRWVTFWKSVKKILMEDT